jgi:GNAT superfamily N-acetyltransferase
LAINRVIGLGFAEPMTPAILERLIEWYAAAGTQRFVIQWSPAAHPPTTADLLADRGFRPVSYWSKLWRPLAGPVPDVAPVESDVTVDEIGPSDALAFERVVADPLGVPADLGAGVRSTIGHPGWRFYLAYRGGAAIAGAAIYCEGDGAWFGLGATKSEFRRHGAQTALLTRRLRDAARAGCRWVSADTMQPTTDKPNPSHRNMLRLGFIPLYDRPNYLSPLLQPST